VTGPTVTDVPGVRVGHWTDPEAATGCTVVLFAEGTVASGEVRGGAPASRELALLEPGRTVERIDALVMTGGSAFGLAAADGVMRFCEERGMGFVTPAGPVPIVPALALFDLMVGDPAVRPGPDAGYAACVAAHAGPPELGRVGAGTGATVMGPGADLARVPGGMASAGVAAGDLVVAALVAVNAAGRPGGDSSLAVDLAGLMAAAAPSSGPPGGGAPTNTVIGLVATNARLDKLACHRVAQGAHDGLARAVFPPHTRADGDAFVVAANGPVEVDADVVRALAAHVVASAIAGVAGAEGPGGAR
jgi:L-aminopeptidase/D-esterase-like protein